MESVAVISLEHPKAFSYKLPGREDVVFCRTKVVLPSLAESRFPYKSHRSRESPGITTTLMTSKFKHLTITF